MMTAEQRRLVRQSVDALKEMPAPVSLLFYGKVFELDPSARRLFHNDLTLQGKKLLDTLGVVADSLDRFDAIRPRLAELGRLHASYGVKREQYEVIATALLWAIGHVLGPDFDAATRDAWQLALTAISGAMLAGT
jgi:hemoglobin-like flavoprotein